ncbi:MAG: hypothetical protein BWY27_01015 [Bacteroidetes bacterium ADurb.Bin234]|nr:MAG: hypothetical protein BWY27_01015 [Bacteroidetes bacterium ADurb.Bin234]
MLSISVLLFVFSSCTREQENNVCLEINNETLKKEIINYYNENKALESEPFIPIVIYRQINDSISFYYISIEFDTSTLDCVPFHFMVKLDSIDVYFQIKGMNRSTFGGRNFLNMKKNSINEIAKKHFPKEYKYILKNGESSTSVLWDGKIRKLTFLNDSLISKEDVINTY